MTQSPPKKTSRPQQTNQYTLVLYLPVLHAGYIKLFDHYQDQLKTIYILDDEAIEFVDQKLDYLRKDIRKLTPNQAKKSLQGYQFSFSIETASLEKLRQLAQIYQTNQDLKLLLPDDDVSQVLLETVFKKVPNKQILLEPVFLRWDKQNTFKKKPPQPDLEISTDKLSKKIMTQAFKTAGNSTDWWRHVGAALVKNNQIIISASNQHTPGGYTPYIDGDPRSASKAGKHIEINTARHAESAVIAEAAKKGIKTSGCDLYVTTFPCPYCARVISHAGIKTLYFSQGYTVLDGEIEIKRAGIKIVKVNLGKETKKLKDKRSKPKPYPHH